MAITMMGRGAAIDPQTLAERQKMADLMYQRSLVPAQNEQSWAQGLSRMLQGGIAGYDAAQVDKDRDAYKQQKVSDMQKLAGALGGGDYKSIIGQLSDPETQMMAFGLAKSDMDSQNQFNKQAQLKAYENALSQQGKQDDRDFELNKMGVQNEYTRANEGLKFGFQKQKLDYDPEKAAQRKLSQLTETLNDPNAPDEVKAAAQQRIESQKSVLEAIKTKGTTVNNIMDKTQSEEQKAMSKGMGERYTENQKGADAASIKNTNIDLILKNLNKANPGAAFELRKDAATVIASLGGDPEKMGIGNATSMSIVEQKLREFVLEQMASQKGPQTDRDYERITRTMAQPFESKQQIQTSLLALKSMNNRAIEHANKLTDWVSTHGSRNAKVKGKTFDQAWREYTETNPLFGGEE
jgi:hypothetical protein